MASLLEHTMINKLDKELGDAIREVGGNIDNVDNISQYPNIIREQLSSNGINLTKNIILEGDSCIIIADEEGRDVYNTEYATGEKTGLNPGAYYIRICTAVKGVEPVYIDCTPISNGNMPGDVDIQDIINRLYETETQIEYLDKRVDYLEKAESDNIDEIVEKVSDKITDEVTDDVTKTIEETFVSDSELEEMMFSIDELEEILTI